MVLLIRIGCKTSPGQNAPGDWGDPGDIRAVQGMRGNRGAAYVAQLGGVAAAGGVQELHRAVVVPARGRAQALYGTPKNLEKEVLKP